MELKNTENERVEMVLEEFPLNRVAVLIPAVIYLQTTTLKMADKGRSNAYIAFTVSLCAFELKRNVDQFAISSYTTLKLGMQTLRSYLKIMYEYEFHIPYQTKKLAPQRIMVTTR